MEEQETKSVETRKKSKIVDWGQILASGNSPEIPKAYFFHAISYYVSKIFFFLWYDLKFKGVENVLENEPVIITPNHQSFCDGYFFASAFSCGTVMHKLYFLTKMRSMMKSAAMLFFVRHSNMIIINAKTNIRESIQILAELLRKKKKVVIFPEGTRTPNGELGDFKPLFAILAKEMGVKVVPTVIAGAYEGLTSRQSLPQRKTKVRIQFLPPVTANADESYADFAKRVREIIATQKAEIDKTLKSK